MDDRIGPYQIIREIGRGGMGVVHLARDTRLDRDVAIKELPELFAQDPARLERFAREAKALAALSHVNLAGIYGVEEQDGAKYLVLEYVEGETLADRLDRGPLPLDEALELAVQIAAGVEAAHEAGIVHRDLKPANIKLTPEGKAKVLDFGLARADEGGSSSSAAGLDSATMTAAQRTPTIEGTILGTAAYMSPEQARGRRVDKRTDIWSYGVVLYEMLVGASPFHGETASDSIGAVLHKEIDLNLLPPKTPPLVRHVLVRCLERNRDNRYRDIGDVRIELERARTEPLSRAEAGGRRLPLAVIAVVALAMTVLGVGAGWLLRPQPTPALMYVSVPLADRFATVDAFDLSPDGEMVAIVARERDGDNVSAETAIYVRRWSEPTFRKLPETERVIRGITFSPSGEQILFQARDDVRPASEVRTVPVAGGPSTRLYTIEQNGLLDGRRGFLAEDEFVVGSADGKELYRVRAGGGTPELITTVTGQGDRWLFSFVMPRAGGRYLMASTWSPSTKTRECFRIDLESGEASLVLEDARDLHLLPDGHLAFVRDQALWVAPFDPATVQVTGPAKGYLSGVENLHLDRGGERAVFAARDKNQERAEIVIVDGAGRVAETLLTVPGEFQDIATLSHDCRRLAYSYNRGDGRGLWVLDIASGLTRQVSPKGDFPYGPAWLPDGRLAYLIVQGGGASEPMVIDAVPGATPQPMLPRAGGEPFRGSEIAISPDGRHVLVSGSPSDGREPGIYLFDMGDGDSGRAFYASDRAEGKASFRPDGKWVVYNTNGTGRFEVFLRPFVADNPESAPIHPVTRQGGTDPIWSPDGRTLYYAGVGADEGQVFAVTVDTEPELKISERRTVLSYSDGVDRIVPMADGRFVKLQPKSRGGSGLPDLRLILDWGLPQLVAAQR
ncbi:MAG: protein kinase [Krumholzibacteria bacterium]|nr:protein kinase [Candidatus Krumholzibacteria bacterium]